MLITASYEEDSYKKDPQILGSRVLAFTFSLYIYILENVLKWSTDSDTNLTVVCRHRWSR